VVGDVLTHYVERVKTHPPQEFKILDEVFDEGVEVGVGVEVVLEAAVGMGVFSAGSVLPGLEPATQR
jgi:hypothetical protein